MNTIRACALATSLLLLNAPDAGAEGTEKFAATGIIVSVYDLYAKGLKQDAAMSKTELDVSRLAFVTPAGIFSFLETPGNQAALRRTKAGSAARITGKLLRSGLLLQVDSLEQVTETIDIDLGKLRASTGEPVEISGSNKCQCGLKVGELKHSCKLGHQHHLEAGDGKLYHYLQAGKGAGLHAGVGSHFRSVAIKGRLFPGQFILVEGATIK